MTSLPEILRKRRKALKLSTEEVAEKIGVSKRTYEYYEDGQDPTKPKDETLRKIAEVLQFKVADVYDEKSVLHQDEESKKEESFINTDTLSGRAILNLTEANKLLAESQKIFAESNKALALTNSELLSMVKGITVDEHQESQQVLPAMFARVRELLIDVALGKRFESKQEVHALLSKVDRAAASNNFSKDTQNN